MSWTDGIDDGGFGEFGGGYAGSPVDASVSGFGADLDGSYGGGVSISGPVGPSNQSSENLGYDISSTDYAAPTGNFKSGVPIAQQVKDNNIYANAVKSAMTAMVPGLGMVQNLGRLLGSQIGNVPNEMMSQVTLDQGLIDQFSPIGSSLATPMGHPHTGGPMLGSPAFANESMMSVPMSGFGAQLGIATARDPHTGLNMGPGRPGEPGDVNPFSGVAYADPGDPYIRKKRGTEIAAMIGP